MSEKTAAMIHIQTDSSAGPGDRHGKKLIDAAAAACKRAGDLMLPFQKDTKK